MATNSWPEANYNYLLATIARVRVALDAVVDPFVNISGNQPAETQAAVDAALEALSSAPALETLRDLFSLTEFECSIIVLCMAMELDPAFGTLCAAANNNPHRPYPTIDLVLRALPEPAWDAFSPHAPLRRWDLIELIERETFTSGFLRINERILHFLLGTRSLDRRLVDLVEPLAASTDLVASHKDVALRLARHIVRGNEETAAPALLLSGNENDGKRSVMAWVCDWLGLRPYVLNAMHVPPLAEEQVAIARLWEREGLLENALLLLDCTDADIRLLAAATAFIERLNAPVVVMCDEPAGIGGRTVLRFTIDKPSFEEQSMLWRSALGTLAESLNGQVDQVVSHFNMGIDGIRSAGIEITTNGLHRGGEIVPDALWNACRVQARSRLDDLAQRIVPRATWDDLILPQNQKATLRQLTAHVRQRLKVYHHWGFAERNSRGLGTSALFAGPSGTGKTLSAEVIAAELKLDLYHIDLSQIVSKYIGETEKNLRRIFDAAEEAGAVLLFDEADALFGKRSEVKDSHDRHANIEVSYLLQRMESFRGLAILTTNMKGALDTAFLRRIRFVVNFPFPDPANRAEIWWRVFPQNTPMDGVDVNKLANLNVAGGSIWNIALNAAFLAADAGEPVQMRHLLLAARSEYAKLEKQLTDAEIRGWV